MHKKYGLGLPPAEELEKYKGKWVAIYGRRVVASGNDLLALHKGVRKKYPERYKKKPPLIIPLEENLPLILTGQDNLESRACCQR